jgi:osmotically-inducible protein OsmY
MRTTSIFQKCGRLEPVFGSDAMKFSQRINAACAALMVAALTACAPTATREGTGEYVDDSVITTKVKAAFAKDDQVKARQVSVETFKGTVQLSGFVDSQAESQRATELARQVKGVKAVKNDTVVKGRQQ